MTTDRLLLCGLHDDDGAQVRDLRKLANWDEALCRQRINEMNAVEAGSPAEDLLRKLLDAEPGRRALNFRGAGMRGVLEHAFFEAIARPAAFVAEQLSPNERARRRITEAQSMVRSPLPIDTNAAGGFLITRAKVLSHGEAVTRADNVLLRDFGDRVSEELRRRGASLQQLRELKARVAKKQNVLEELRAGNVPKEKAGHLEAQYEAELEGARGALSEVQTCETGRNLRYLANLTQALYLVRNFTRLTSTKATGARWRCRSIAATCATCWTPAAASSCAFGTLRRIARTLPVTCWQIMVQEAPAIATPTRGEIRGRRSLRYEPVRSHWAPQSMSASAQTQQSSVPEYAVNNIEQIS